VLWLIPVILALGRVRQEDQKLEVRLDYTESSRLAWANTFFFLSACYRVIIKYKMLGIVKVLSK
jgi:hypothetical protein